MNGATPRQGEPVPLKRWLRAAAEAAGDAPALECAGTVLNYRELMARVSALSARLEACGFEAGERIAIAASRSIDSIVAILGVVDAGLAYVPLDLGYPGARLQAMLADAAARAVIGEAAALDALRAAAGDFPRSKRPHPRPAPYGAADDLTYVLFTSGSTGRPKGVAMGQRPLAHLIGFHAAHPRLGRPARTLQFAPLSFDVHCQEVFSTMACRGTLVLLPEADRRDPQRLQAAMVDGGVERVFLPYVALQMLAEASRDAAPAALREVVSAGEQLCVTPAIRALFARLPGAELHNHYGPTESHVVTAHELRGDPTAWPDIPPIGPALPHVEVALWDAERDAPEAGDTGELLLGGDTLAHGYLGRAELSAERFGDAFAGLPGRWYRTGDLVRREADGGLLYLGRADQQVKVDGFRIEPGEIEVALMAHPAVKDAAVAAPEAPGAGRTLVAWLVPREAGTDVAALASSLRPWLRERLPEYMVPARFVGLAALPTTPSGKIDRLALPVPAAEAHVAGADPVSLARALWQELLGLNDLRDDHNLFDLGARSLLVLRFVSRLQEHGVRGVSVADVYDRPTLAGLAARLRGDATRPAARHTAPKPATTEGIAIVGMAVRAAGAPDVDALWQRLLDGSEGIRHFTPEELDASVPEAVKRQPNFVAARGVLDDAGRFDAAFFGVPPREAVLLDPQQRLLLELAWNALEHAAIDPARHEDWRVGVYAGTANNSYMPALRSEAGELVQQAGEFAAMLASEKDYVATRIAHKLDLHGPAVSVHTACSTGLVAVAQAWHALASGQCDVALAGGATVLVPQQAGYLHVEGGMESADGHCRPFDAAASGTVFGSAGALVVLKRLEDALADGDTVHAVIRGVGLNNDGGEKASFTAPSVAGQAAAVRMALDHAGVEPASIGYVEAHGTGTALGDPIEVAALTRAWGSPADTPWCTLGSLKGHFGHTIAAAGVLGLVKATLALQRELIPATLHFERPNPHIDFERTPFRVSGTAVPWPRAAAPRRAAVSSFGVGGTNAHVVIEEAPALAPKPAATPSERRWLLPLSARTAEGVQARAAALAEHLRRRPDLPLDAVAATLMRGRRAMPWRASVAARDAASAAEALVRIKPANQALDAPRVVFLFPGQGAQHPGMAGSLYVEAPAFREALDRCLAAARRHTDADLHAWIVQADPHDEAVAAKLAETRHAQPALFAMGYALAAWLESLGVQPAAMIGHSIGELAAACRAGVFALDEAVGLVVARGAAMQAQAAGAMLAVRQPAEALAASLPGGLEIAGCNAPQLTVVAGPQAAIDAYAAALAAAGSEGTPLKVSHAFHSASMDGALPAVAAAAARARPRAPKRPLYSCLTGEPLADADATDPAYWARQMRSPVQFSRAVQAEAAKAGTLFVEVGPNQALTALVRQHRVDDRPARVLPLLGRASAPGDAAALALAALGELWCAGVAVAWAVPSSARRVPLPGYPFAGATHWFERRAVTAPSPSNAPLPRGPP